MSTDGTDIMTDGLTPEQLDAMRLRTRARLKQMRVSAREASEMAGLGLSFVNDFLSGRSKKPSEDNIIKLAEVLEMSISQLVASGDVPGGSAPPTSLGGSGGGNHQIMVPLYAVGANIAMNQAFLPFTGDPVGMLPTLPSLEHVRGAYAFTVPNDMNAPRYMAGEVVYISPAASPRVGDFVFVKFQNGEAGVARLAAADGESVGFDFIGAPEKLRSRSVNAEEIASIHRIIGSVG
jgi:transcriptional regulator with XRE-family HTH domain